MGLNNLLMLNTSDVTGVGIDTRTHNFAQFAFQLGQCLVTTAVTLVGLAERGAGCAGWGRSGRR